MGFRGNRHKTSSQYLLLENKIKIKKNQKHIFKIQIYCQNWKNKRKFCKIKKFSYIMYWKHHYIIQLSLHFQGCSVCRQQKSSALTRWVGQPWNHRCGNYAFFFFFFLFSLLHGSGQELETWWDQSWYSSWVFDYLGVSTVA